MKYYKVSDKKTALIGLFVAWSFSVWIRHFELLRIIKTLLTKYILFLILHHWRSLILKNKITSVIWKLIHSEKYVSFLEITLRESRIHALEKSSLLDCLIQQALYYRILQLLAKLIKALDASSLHSEDYPAKIYERGF